MALDDDALRRMLATNFPGVALPRSVAARLPGLPDVPTFGELGFAEANLGSVFGLFAPARTPAEALRRINAEVNALLAAKDVQDRLARLDLQPAGSSTDAFAALVQREHEAMGRLVREAGLKAD